MLWGGGVIQPRQANRELQNLFPQDRFGTLQLRAIATLHYQSRLINVQNAVDLPKMHATAFEARSGMAVASFEHW
jgi:hypothetical protein